MFLNNMEFSVIGNYIDLETESSILLVFACRQLYFLIRQTQSHLIKEKCHGPLKPFASLDKIA